MCEHPDTDKRMERHRGKLRPRCRACDRVRYARYKQTDAGKRDAERRAGVQRTRHQDRKRDAIEPGALMRELAAAEEDARQALMELREWMQSDEVKWRLAA